MFSWVYLYQEGATRGDIYIYIWMHGRLMGGEGPKNTRGRFAFVEERDCDLFLLKISWLNSGGTISYRTRVVLRTFCLEKTN